MSTSSPEQPENCFVPCDPDQIVFYLDEKLDNEQIQALFPNRRIRKAPTFWSKVRGSLASLTRRESMRNTQAELLPHLGLSQRLRQFSEDWNRGILNVTKDITKTVFGVFKD